MFSSVATGPLKLTDEELSFTKPGLGLRDFDEKLLSKLLKPLVLELKVDLIH
jgi:hypothetical protein